MKILCPMDFSEAAINGMEYAAHLAKVLSGQLTLLYVRVSVWPEALPLEHQAKDSSEDISIRLQEMSNEIQFEFQVPCNYCIDCTTNTLPEAIANQAKKQDLIIMGTNGVSNSYQYIFGTNTYHVIEKTQCPLMIVPQGYVYKPIQNIVYAFEPDTNPIFLIDQLKRLVVPIKAAVRVVHVSEDEPSNEAHHKLQALREAVLARAVRDIEWNFESLFSKDISWALDHYMKTHQADVLALSFHHRTFMEKLFKGNVVRQISMILEYPTFVFWH
ncbi:universal stress protein [Cytophagales bacterium WSM2-2]|nr:universal stress protein [Cytophagales bacterium WSM2-2]